MPVSIASLDILEQAQFPPAQARALVRILEIEAAAHREDLATKSDLAELRTATKSDIAELRAATKADIAELRAATKADIAELRHEVADLKVAMIDSVKEAKVDTMRFTVWVMMSQSTLLAGVMYFFLQHLR